MKRTKAVTDAPFCARLPDVPLTLADGGSINLADFCGQKLVVFFCPAGDLAVEDEFQSYEMLAEEFEDAGAWVVGIVSTNSPASVKVPHGHMGIDADGSTYKALSSRSQDVFEAKAADGTTFLIDRDGSIRHAWPGYGHARQVLNWVRERP